jgi:hypothetical protein
LSGAGRRPLKVLKSEGHFQTELVDGWWRRLKPDRPGNPKRKYNASNLKGYAMNITMPGNQQSSD